MNMEILDVGSLALYNGRLFERVTVLIYNLGNKKLEKEDEIKLVIQASAYVLSRFRWREIKVEISYRHVTLTSGNRGLLVDIYYQPPPLNPNISLISYN